MSNNNDNESVDTAPCRKCKQPIPVTADRCPECGYEPKVSIFQRILTLGPGLAMLISFVVPISGISSVLSGDFVTGITQIVFGGLLIIGLYKMRNHLISDDWIKPAEGVSKEPRLEKLLNKLTP